MPPPKKAEIKWDPAPGFKEAYRSFRNTHPEIRAAMLTFNEYKRGSPPRRLPAKMMDHKLDGPLKGFMDCHLSDDVILIYKPQPNGGMQLLTVCQHNDLRGPRAKVLAKKLRSFLK
jgi:mRNA-degrading endonuclease YafQ of YafQ-DinJ toxin-antitoxin module